MFEFINAVLDAANQFILIATDLYKDELRWLLPGYILNPMIILIWGILSLVLEGFIPAKSRKPLLNSNVLFDYSYPVFAVVFTLGVVPVGYVSVKWLYNTYLPFLNTGILDDKPFALQVIGALIISDFSYWASHWIRHKVKWLWYFHTIHHSQRELNPFTENRSHVIDLYLDFILKTIPMGFVGGTYPAWIVYTYVNSFWGYFIHANLKTNLWFLKYIIVSPQYHRIHHSIEPEHRDKNFGERIVLWDWMFGTMGKDMDTYPDTGVTDCEFIEETSVNPLQLVLTYFKQCIYPFIMVYRSIGKVSIRHMDAQAQVGQRGSY